MKRPELVKRAKLAGLRGNRQKSDFLIQELAALTEAAGPYFKHVPEDLLTTQFDVATCVALTQTCKHLRVICGLLLDWVPHPDETYSRRLLSAFVRATSCTAPQLRDSLRPHLSVLHLTHAGRVITANTAKNGHVVLGETAGRPMALCNPNGCAVKGTKRPRPGMSLGPLDLPCCYGAPLPVDKPTRWLATNIKPGCFGVGVVGINGSRSMSVLWLSSGFGETRVGRLAGPWCSVAGLGPDAVLPREAENDEEEEEEEEHQEQEGFGDLLEERELVRHFEPDECVGLEYDPLRGSLTLVHPRLGTSYRVKHELLAAASGWRWHVSVVASTFLHGCYIRRLLA